MNLSLKQSGRVPRLAAAFVVLGFSVLVSGCLEPPSSYSATNPGIDAPDPAMQPETIGGGDDWTQVFGGYGCGSVQCGQGVKHYDIDTYSIPYPPSGTSGASISDALGGKMLANVVQSWAPTVLYVGTQFVMYYSDWYGPGGRANCISQATSSDGIDFTNTPKSTFNYCSSDKSHGYLDPSLFQDVTTGNVYLLFSEQWFNSVGQPCGDGPNSKIWIQPLNSTGLATSGSPTDLLDWNQAHSIYGLMNKPLGSGACLENPQLVNDNYNSYDLLFSIGTYLQNSTYYTGQVACLALNNTGSGCGTDDQAGGVTIENGGGASTLFVTDPGDNWMIYAMWNSGNTLRNDYEGPTSSCNPNPGPCA